MCPAGVAFVYKYILRDPPKKIKTGAIYHDAPFYDENPDGRFVLINGRRLGEGDELQAGLVVGEIRRDGVVFTYRLYRFFVGR